MPFSRTPRTLLFALTLGVVATFAPALVDAPPADATSTYLCTGYKACESAGYSSSGYAANSGKMYWRMYSGHNCTNYAAFRMIKAGYSSTRPWSGNGNASNWGHAMSSITDRSPSVGAIAWWDRGVPGAGSAGHVAYVEQVVSPTEIVISEDSWSGDFHWRRLYNTGSGWPSGFIHFADKPLLDNKTLPKVKGVAVVDGQLTAGAGSWTLKPSSVAFQWRADGVNIPGATSSTYSPTVEMLGKSISVVAKATRVGTNVAKAVSAATPPVAKAALTNAAPPVVTGDPVVGQVLTATPASWSAAPSSLVYKWYVGGVLTQSSDQPTLALTADMVGKQVRVAEAARRPGYVMSRAASGFSASVLAGVITQTTPFSINGVVRRGQRLVVTPAALAPADATVAYTWFRDGVQVPAVTGPRYPLTVDDVGARLIRVRMTVSKPDWRGFTRNYDVSGPVTTNPVVRVRTFGRKRAAAVKVRVVARGVAVPTGVVRIHVGKRTVTRKLVDGRVKVRLENLTAGSHQVSAIYYGTTVIRRGTTKTRVVVLPKTSR